MAEAVTLPHKASCTRTVFSPVPELVGATARAAARWAAATGCDIHVGPAGIPVLWVSSVSTPDGEPVNGATDCVMNPQGQLVGCLRVRIARTARDPERTILHEIGHALGASSHLEHGLMAAAPATAALLDPAAVDLICSELDCASQSEVL